MKFEELFEKKTKVKDKTLFACRPLVNVSEFKDWATEQGFKSALKDDDLHVTIAYSKKPFNWSDIEPDDNDISVDGGERSIEQFGDAIVLCFDSNVLQERWQELIDDGASWDHDSYRPHVTITYENDDEIDISKVKPYEGELVFGPENFQELDDDWAHDHEEDDLTK